MKKLLLLLALCVPAFAQIQAWGSGQAAGDAFSLTLTSCATNHAYLIVATISTQYYSSILNNVHSTSIANANWHHGSDVVASGGIDHSSLWYAYSTSIADSETITFTFNGPSSNSHIAAQCYSGVSAVTQLDQSSTNPCPSSSYSTCQPGSVTPVQGGELLVAEIYGAGSFSTATINSGFTQAPAFTANYPQMAYLIQTSPGTVNPTFTVAYGGHDAGAAIMTFFSANPPADYSVTAPSPESGYVHAASGTFTITKATGSFNGSQTVIVADGSQGSTVTPQSGCGSAGTTPLTITPTSGYSSCTFTITPVVTGALTLTFTGSGMSGLNPSNQTYTSNNLSLALSCASGSGLLNVASGTCTVTLTGGAFNNSYTVTVSDSGEYFGGTFAPSVGSPAVSSVTVKPASGTTFTFTYTPTGTVGARLLNVTNVQGWINPSSVTYTAITAEADVFTAKATGNWNVSGTWNCSGACTHGYPTTGDTAAITGFHVTCPAGTACMVGTAPANNTTYDLTVTNGASADGVVEVASGATLMLTSNYELANTTATSTPSYFARLTLDTGATLLLDNDNSASVSYRGVGAATNKWAWINAGTAGDACTLGSAYSYTCSTAIKGINTSGGAQPQLWAINSTGSDINYQVYGTAFKNCGTATLPCLDNAWGIGSSYAATMDVEGSVFDTSNPFDDTGSYPIGGSFMWANNREVNDLAGIVSTGVALQNASPCTITNNFFDLRVNNDGNDPFHGCNMTWNFFSHSLGAAQSPTLPWGSFQNNFHSTGAGAQSADQRSFVPILGNLFYEDNSTGITSNHIGFFSAGHGYNYTLIGNLCFTNDPTAHEGHCGGNDTAGVSSPLPDIVMDNLAPMTAAGNVSGSWLSNLLSGESAGNTLASPSYVDHNGANGSGVAQGWGPFTGHGTTYYPTNAIWQTYRANIGWAPSAGSNNFQIVDLEQAANTPTPTTLVNASTVIDWNDSYNATASSLFNGSASPQAACKPSTFNGTPYQLCSATYTIGSHEQSVNPKYIDTTRTPDTWASRVMGQAASLAGVRAAVWGCQNMAYCLAGMFSWVRQGWQPTNMALKGVAHDGKIAGFKTITAGSGYSGTCGVTITPQDAQDLGGAIPAYAASATCAFASGAPVVTLVSGGAHYRIATPATVAFTCNGGACSPTQAAVLTPIIQPSDIGPVPISLFASVAP